MSILVLLVRRGNRRGLRNSMTPFTFLLWLCLININVNVYININVFGRRSRSVAVSVEVEATAKLLLMLHKTLLSFHKCDACCYDPSWPEGKRGREEGRRGGLEPRVASCTAGGLVQLLLSRTIIILKSSSFQLICYLFL